MSDVFISYANQDKKLLDEFKRHLKPIARSISFWDDSKILPGQKWKSEILQALSGCRVGVLFASADFFNSDFIQDIEVPSLLKSAEEKGAVILTVILKPCLFSEYEDISQYQAINPPNYTVIEMSEQEREKLWIKLVRRIKTILDDASRK
ncbi:toll/interleukin-1 receptor domain-containing protein [Paraflavitalea pollutisoli]|uniref:toll/interleukin-1 receptor domain-containing protein n=1 Tax=Paraflavitalea pollutisoli TaxID=3034143 RepID=UPI0023ED9BF7|nr:toll/interleukin-1 receptor domain-containing protein [Paraflavitalea sp. H1-2-19X]